MIGASASLATPQAVTDVLQFVGIDREVSKALGRVYSAYEEVNGEAIAWTNRSIEVGGGTWISAPGVVALMLSQIRPYSFESVLEIGVGTALHATAFRLIHPGSRITGVDPSPGMRARAAALGKSIGLGGFEIIEGFAQDLPPRDWDLIYATAAMSFKDIQLAATLSNKRPLLLQAPHPITQSEFDSEPPTSWLKRTFGDYAGYIQSNSVRRYLAISTFLVDTHNEWSRVATTYDFTFVPYERNN